jgi:DHHC palmitoyltransferase
MVYYNMKIKSCPNPECLVFSLAVIGAISIITSISPYISIEIKNSYVFLSVLCEFLCIFTFLSDPSADSYNEMKPLLKINFKVPYKLCSTCKIYMQKGTEHCTQCGVCIPGYRNHWILLSNCIGTNNKKLFYLLLAFMNLWGIANVAVGVCGVFYSWQHLAGLGVSLGVEGYIGTVSVLVMFINR